MQARGVIPYVPKRRLFPVGCTITVANNVIEGFTHNTGTGVITVPLTAHGLTAGDLVMFSMTGGDQGTHDDAWVSVLSVIDANTFTAQIAAAGSPTNVTLYGKCTAPDGCTLDGSTATKGRITLTYARAFTATPVAAFSQNAGTGDLTTILTLSTLSTTVAAFDGMTQGQLAAEAAGTQYRYLVGGV